MFPWALSEDQDCPKFQGCAWVGGLRGVSEIEGESVFLAEGGQEQRHGRVNTRELRGGLADPASLRGVGVGVRRPQGRGTLGSDCEGHCPPCFGKGADCPCVLGKPALAERWLSPANELQEPERPLSHLQHRCVDNKSGTATRKSRAPSTHGSATCRESHVLFPSFAPLGVQSATSFS